MGVFNQFSNFLPGYGKKGSDANTLNGLLKKVPWTFDEDPKYNRALESIKKRLTSDDLMLNAPDHRYPLHLETAGSDGGWGAVLFQVFKGTRRVIRMSGKQ
jgi:hypothetical protein